MPRVRFLVPVIALALAAAGCSAGSSAGSASVAPSSTSSVAAPSAGPTASPLVAPTATHSPTPRATPPAKPTAAPTARPTKAPSVATRRAVSIANFSFGPGTLVIPVGATVTWTNHDMTDHTVTADIGLFASGSLASGAAFSHTFRTAGSFPYHCSIHPYMTGTITVR